MIHLYHTCSSQSSGTILEDSMKGDKNQRSEKARDGQCLLHKTDSGTHICCNCLLRSNQSTLKHGCWESYTPSWVAANKWWLLSKGQSGMSPGRSTMTQWLSPQAYIGKTNWAQMLFLKMDINLGSTGRTIDHCPHNLEVLWGQWELNTYAYI